MQNVILWNARPQRKKIPSFINTPVVKMKPSPLFAKESLIKNRRNLKPWGDVDLDGTPNKFDCNPFNAAEDGIIKNIFSKGKRIVKNIGKDVVRRAKPNLNLRSGKYAKQSLRSQKKFSGGVISAIRAFTPQGTLPVASKKAGTGKKGRPQGPSGRYFIPGVGPVGVYEYRTWLRQQKRISRINARAEGNPLPARRYAQEESMQSPAVQVQPNAESFNELDQIVEPEQPRLMQPVGTDNLDYQKQMQLIMQQRDNILFAPQFLKGELKGAGGDILNETGRPNILQAPNINLGQMRNLQPRNPVELGERPITNPMGNYFTTIDPITGNSIVQRRVTEKWMTGEAL